MDSVAKPSDRPACDTCLYWRQRDTLVYGYCRRFPPILEKQMGYDFYATLWPSTLAADLCGDWTKSANEPH